jgi:predicted  nucleic acid-binding Zn-ribbon protein
MARLTNALKTEIIGNWYIEKQKKKMVNIKNEFFNALRKYVEEQIKENIEVWENNQHLAKYLGIYEGVDIYINKDNVSTVELPERYCITLDVKKYASADRYSKVGFNINRDNNIKKILQEYNKKVTELNSEKQVITNLLASVTTVKKLVDLLPEIEKYIPDTKKLSTTLVNSSDLVKAKSLM